MRRRPYSRRLWSAVGIATGLLAVLALVPYYGLLASVAASEGFGAVPRVAVLLLPGTIALALPVALSMISMSSSKLDGKDAVRLASWSTMASLLLLGWIVPAANAATVSARTASPVTPREVSVSSLLRSADVPESRAELYTRGTIVLACSIAVVGGLATRRIVQRLV